MPYDGGNMFKLLNDVTAVGASRCVRLRENQDGIDVYAEFTSLAATKISAVTIELQGSINANEELYGVLTDPTLAIDSTATRFANACAFSISFLGDDPPTPGLS